MGYTDNAVWNLSTFEGQPITSSAAIVKYTWLSDANLDGQVTSADLAILNNGQQYHLTGWYNGDFNYDGVINADDYALFELGEAEQNLILAPSVPEPTVTATISLVALATLRRRRHR